MLPAYKEEHLLYTADHLNVTTSIIMMFTVLSDTDTQLE